MTVEPAPGNDSEPVKVCYTGLGEERGKEVPDNSTNAMRCKDLRERCESSALEKEGDLTSRESS